MPVVKKLDLHLRRTGGGILHDSRADTHTLVKCIEACVQKINELVDANNTLHQQITNITSETDAAGILIRPQIKLE